MPYEDDETTQVLPVAGWERTELPSGGDPFLVVLAGRALGRMFRVVEGEHLIGRSSTATVSLEDEGVSREHARLLVRADGEVALQDLRSTNGTWVESMRIGEDPRILREGDRIRVGPYTILKYGRQDVLEQQVLAGLYQAATRDAVTGLLNKRFFRERLDQELAWHRRHGGTLTLMMVDLDHFKGINDRYGHVAGDAVLRHVGERLTASLRTEDLLARWGGEEFGVILRETSPKDAASLAERLRAVVHDQAYPHAAGAIRLSTSIGVVSRAGDALPRIAEQFVELADRALYRAKHGGRNRVEMDA